MFKKLRSRFVIITMTITTIVLVIAFSAIYFIAAEAANQRHPKHDNLQIVYTEDISHLIEDRITLERRESLASLFMALLTTGLFVEAIALIAAIYFSEQSVRPVQKAYNAQKTFIANASHEIKTPLAAIQANLEAADIKGNHWIDNIQSEVEDLTALNNQLLTLARLEGEFTPKKDYSTINLLDYTNQLLTPIRPRLEQKQIELSIDSSQLSKPKASLPRADLKQILNILLDNAIKYCDQKIIITLENNSITVANDGATISAKNLPHIFDRFYQTDKSKNGVGLGLAIAKQVADQNHWHLSATSDHKLTTFNLKW